MAEKGNISAEEWSGLNGKLNRAGYVTHTRTSRTHPRSQQQQ